MNEDPRKALWFKMSKSGFADRQPEVVIHLELSGSPDSEIDR